MNTLDDIRDEIQNAPAGASTHMEVLTICEHIVDYLRERECHKATRSLEEPLTATDLSNTNENLLRTIHSDWCTQSGNDTAQYDFDWFKQVLNDEIDLRWFVRGWLARHARVKL